MSTVNILKKMLLWSVVSSRYMVDEPTVEDTISILRGLKERYEVFHGVKITDSCTGICGSALKPLYFRPFPAG